MPTNRYLKEEHVQLLLEEAERKFTYTPPDAARVEEHEAVNNLLLNTVRELTQILPDCHERDIAVDCLWLCRAAANGALAVGTSSYLDEEEKLDN